MNHTLTKQESKKQILALILSIGLHSILLLGSYYLLLSSSSSSQRNAYHIQISHPSIQEGTQQAPQEEAPSQQVEQATQEQPMATSPTGKTTTESSPSDQKQATDTQVGKQNQAEPQQPTTSLEEHLDKQVEQEPTPSIDERSLYQVDSEEQTGAALELVGWVWDSIPEPEDTTNETGKLVFEITIDNLGEVIAVKTLEKTVSPLVEQLYKDTVAKLTFSKTTTNKVYAPTSVGKVTFVIKAK